MQRICNAKQLIFINGMFVYIDNPNDIPLFLDDKRRSFVFCWSIVFKLSANAHGISKQATYKVTNGCTT
jgi:hypothetical protein